MLEIFLIAICGLMMAKHGTKRRRGGVRPLKVDESAAAGALVAQDAIAIPFTNTVVDKTFLISLKAIWSMRGHTAGDESVLFGVVHGDYSSAEIEEWIEANGSWDAGDLVAREQANRKIRQVGTFAGLLLQETLNDGVAITTPLRFYVNAGDTLSLWVYNASGSSWTTGTVMNCNGTVWAKR